MNRMPSLRSRLGLASILALTLTSASFALAQDEAPPSLDGKWKTTQAGSSKSFTAVWDFKGNQFSLEMTRSDGRKVNVQGKVVIVDGKAAPKKFDLKEVKATVDSKEVAMPDRMGIFTIVGNELTMRLGATRPAAIDGVEAENDPSFMKLNKIE